MKHRRLSELSTAAKMCSPCLRLYIAVVVMINTTACSEIHAWNTVLQRHVTTGPLLPVYVFV